MRLDEYSTLDAVGLADLIRQKQVSAAEVQAAATTALEAVSAGLNALADGPWQNPLAYDPAGPFAGVPFVLKDITPMATGVRSRSGSWMTGDGLEVAQDTHLMERIRAGGLAVMGLATTDELGFGANTDTPRFGRTLNPWDLAMSPGGSSGGSASLVAAGAVPMASASDAGGSIRIPASVTGTVGLKPSRGRLPVGPGAQESHWGLATHFLISRSVRDCAAALDALSGPMPGDKYFVPKPARSWTAGLADSGPLRVAFTTEPWAHSPVAGDVRQAVTAAAGKLAELGHHVERGMPRFDWASLLKAVQVLGCASTAIDIARLEAKTGQKADTRLLQPIILSYCEIGRRLSVVDVGEALVALNEISRSFAAFFQDWDLLITPNMTMTSWRADDFNPTNPPVDAMEWMRKMFDEFCYTAAFNITGGPAISLPTGWTEAGFPIGIQLAADLCDEDKLLRVCAELEVAMPWSQRRPPTHVTCLAPPSKNPS
jgi:amidase